MTYEETLHYLYTSVPVFQHSGTSAYKPGLGTSVALDDHLGNPHRNYRTIHVAGTNGKGSVSHLLAAVLQRAGYKVGLYTSPHLVDFRERIRVNGQMIPKGRVIDFVERHRSFFEPLHPSFFELTSSLAFDHFREERVDFAVIEVGLGGRLDSTNIITPILSVITNISLDHTQFLGDTVERIAYEKAGIIKPGVPALLGEPDAAGSVLAVIRQKAMAEKAPFHTAEDAGLDAIKGSFAHDESGCMLLRAEPYGELTDELTGEAQVHNARTVLAALRLLGGMPGITIPAEAVREGFRRVTELTGLMGRWQTLHEHPRVIGDTGHNPGGWEYLGARLERISRESGGQLYMIVGMVGDKDVDSVLSRMPKQARYLFTQASVSRAMPVETFAAKARARGLEGESFGSVREAVETALARAGVADTLFIGGSTFVVADALPLFTAGDKQDSTTQSKVIS